MCWVRQQQGLCPETRWLQHNETSESCAGQPVAIRPDRSQTNIHTEKYKAKRFHRFSGMFDPMWSMMLQEGLPKKILSFVIMAICRDLRPQYFVICSTWCVIRPIPWLAIKVCTQTLHPLANGWIIPAIVQQQKAVDPVKQETSHQLLGYWLFASLESENWNEIFKSGITHTQYSKVSAVISRLSFCSITDLLVHTTMRYSSWNGTSGDSFQCTRMSRKRAASIVEIASFWDWQKKSFYFSQPNSSDMQTLLCSAVRPALTFTCDKAAVNQKSCWSAACNTFQFASPKPAEFICIHKVLLSAMSTLILSEWKGRHWISFNSVSEFSYFREKTSGFFGLIGCTAARHSHKLSITRLGMSRPAYGRRQISKIDINCVVGLVAILIQVLYTQPDLESLASLHTAQPYCLHDFPRVQRCHLCVSWWRDLHLQAHKSQKLLHRLGWLIRKFLTVSLSEELDYISVYACLSWISIFMIVHTIAMLFLYAGEGSIITTTIYLNTP